VDWVTISALATAGGTLVLAGTTYASVRSANRAARVAEQSLLAGLRPLIIQSSDDDQPIHVGFSDGVRLTVPGGEAAVEVADGRVYIVLSLRNVGPGIGILHSGFVGPSKAGVSEHEPLDEHRRLIRDLYLPPGKVGFWQIAFREEDARRDEVRSFVESGVFTVELLYGDFEGGQRMVTRLSALRDDDDHWNLAVVRHWQIDRPDPR
jgi:hypothetical protein